MTIEQYVLRKQRVRDCVFEDLDRIWLRSINMIKLWFKWEPLIKDSAECNQLCPKPSDAIIAKVKVDKSLKQL